MTFFPICHISTTQEHGIHHSLQPRTIGRFLDSMALKQIYGLQASPHTSPELMLCNSHYCAKMPYEIQIGTMSVHVL